MICRFHSIFVCLVVGLLLAGGWSQLAYAEGEPHGFDYDPDLDADTYAPPEPSPDVTQGVRKRRQVSKPRKKASRRRMKNQFTVGVGFDPNAGFLASAGLAGRDFFGIDGLHLSLDGKFGGWLQKTDMTLAYDPSNSHLFTRLGIGFQRRRFGLLEDGALDLSEQQIGGFVDMGVKWGKGWRAFARYRLQQHTYENGDLLQGAPVAMPGDLWRHPRWLSALQLQLSYEDPKGRDPRSGMRIGFRLQALVEASHQTLGSDFQYLRGELHASWATMLPGGLHLSLGVSGGALIGDQQALPFGMRYRLGGALGQSSWLADVGPQMVLGDRSISIGGQGMVRAHTELRVPLVRKIGLYAFGGFEAGALFHNVSATPGDPTGLNLQASWGASAIVGLVWRSPIGPLRFGLSIPLVRQHPDDPPVIFGFGLGGSF